MIKHQGGCYCGQIRFTTEFDPMLVMNCHCRTCKKISGANLSSFAAFYESEILITGDRQSFEYKGTNGKKMEKEFCGQCGSQIFTRPELIEGMVYLNLGNFYDWEAFKPKVEIWTDYKSSWLGKFDCVAETFVDNGALEKIQMFMENLDQRE